MIGWWVVAAWAAPGAEAPPACLVVVTEPAGLRLTNGCAGPVLVDQAAGATPVVPPGGSVVLAPRVAVTVGVDGALYPLPPPR